MPFFAQIAVATVALLHFGFLTLEMFLWDKPQGMRIFGTTPEYAKQSKALAANQGLYNGFLAVGLIWSLFPIGAPDAAKAIATFFLICVIIAGIYGAASVSTKILRVQALPGVVALAVVWMTGV